MAKLTPEIVRRIHERKANGATYADIRREFGLSQGSVRNALTMRPEAAGVKRGRWAAKTDVTEQRQKQSLAQAAPRAEQPDQPDLPDDDEAPTIDEVRRWLGAQVRDLRLQARRQKNGEPSAYAATSRNLTAASLALARLTPKPVDDPSEHPDMVQAAEDCRVKLHDMLDRVLEDPESPFVRPLADSSSGSSA